MDFGINSSIDLYKRLTPAMNCKIRELFKCDIDYIKNEDIWNYLMEVKWRYEKGITLAEMVDDILNLDNAKLENFVKGKLKNINDSANLDEVELL